MSEEHTVEVTFLKDFGEYDTPEQFVRDCLTGRRSNSFAHVADVEVADA